MAARTTQLALDFAAAPTTLVVVMGARRIGRILDALLGAQDLGPLPCVTCGDRHPGVSRIFIVLPDDYPEDDPDAQVPKCPRCGASLGRDGRSLRLKPRIILADPEEEALSEA